MRAGPRIEPRPTPSDTIASKTPNARASTASLASRTGRLNSGTSMTAFAAPTTASMSEAQRRSPGVAPSTAIGAPQRASAMASHPPRWRLPTRSAGAERAEDAADAERGREGGDAAVAGVEQVEGEHDDEHVHRAADRALREAEAEHEPQVGVVGHAVDALAELAPEGHPRRRSAGRYGRAPV